MTKATFTASVFSAFLLIGGAHAQGSNQGTPNSLHGSGDMMQDGPHASSNPNANAELGMPPRTAQAIRLKVCDQRWRAAQTNGTAGAQTRDQFVGSCMNSM
jgi:hypothetical protein